MRSRRFLSTRHAVVGSAAQALEALPLAFGGHVNEKLHDLVAVVDKAALELAYRREAHPGLLARRKLVASDSALLAFLALRVKPAECTAHSALQRPQNTSRDRRT